MSPIAKRGIRAGIAGLAAGAELALATAQGTPRVAALPAGVQAEWDVAKAFRQSTPSRERICLNGLWQWRPAGEGATLPPPDGWGWFKVPGCWPGITDYMQKDCQTVFPHPDWQGQSMGDIRAAWYGREIAIPPGWDGRRIVLTTDYLNSLAIAFVDGRPAGTIRFPGGELDLTAVCRAGEIHRLDLHVVALPLKAVLSSYTDSASARQVEGRVARRGLCGDVWLTGVPAGRRLEDVRVTPSVRRGGLTIEADLAGPRGNGGGSMEVRVLEGEQVVHEFRRPVGAGADRLAVWEAWTPPRRWDLHTPTNQYEIEVALRDAGGRLEDVGWRTRFGFREFWVEGRDFHLNGTRVFLSAVPLDNAQVGAAWAGYAAARESLERLRSFGINFVYTHNYGCEPGSHLAFTEILRAADDVGMLVSLSQPHFSHYDWQASDADDHNGYAAHAAFYVQEAGSHPSVVAYAMSHNATGYSEDMNPDLLDGRHDARDTWAVRNVRLALRAGAIVSRLDPERLVYHHASGNLGPMHPVNFYPNFVPIQELSDWFGHWATEGVKPVFLCEYGAPFSWDWTMYRGWYQGQREFGSAQVPWEFCLAEWNAQLLGDAAYALSEPEKANLRWEARQFRAGRVWHRWDYPYRVGWDGFTERFPVFAAYLTDNWRAFRTWEVSAISPWEHGLFWRLRDGVDRGRRELAVDWEHLQRPGFSADYLDQRYERLDLAYEQDDWEATPAAEALLRNNRPLLGYIAGKPSAFTSKDHNFVAGETVSKQLIVINNSRATVDCDVAWECDLPAGITGSVQVSVPTGEQARIPVRIELPDNLPGGSRTLRARFAFSTGEVQTDLFQLDIPAPRAPASVAGRIAVFDPPGETLAWMQAAGIRAERVDAGTDLSGFDLLVVGKSALTPDAVAPDLGAVRVGLRVIVFEQTGRVLEQRLGFRVAEYGLRQVFPRVSDHPAIEGLRAGHLRDWRGEATLLPPRLDYTLDARRGPTVEWCGFAVPRLWRCGNRGNVASVLIEKPACGDFLPILDGGYALQYSPLLEYHEGQGMVLFCQLDVTGRTEADPVADQLRRRLLDYALGWHPEKVRSAVFAGDPAGLQHLEAAGVRAAPLGVTPLAPDQVLVVGQGGDRVLAPRRVEVTAWLAGGGRVLALGTGPAETDAFMPSPVRFERRQFIAASFDSLPSDSPWRGIGPADLHNRDPRDIALLVSGGDSAGGGVLGVAEGGGVVFCQLAPWDFQPDAAMNQKRTFRRLAFVASRLLGNLGVRAATPLLERFAHPLASGSDEQRWLAGLYLDQPEEWDDPYRFFRW
ncbi:MAG: hypothetical protein H7A45_01000 [Verrucomicrobiales bacterium]|nr:hypothetical protein [Verrucomicrobiales bacterium]